MQKNAALDLRGPKLEGEPVDFSHGDVDAHLPDPRQLRALREGRRRGRRAGLHALPRQKGNPRGHRGEALRLLRREDRPDEKPHPHARHAGRALPRDGREHHARRQGRDSRADYFGNRKMTEFFGGELVPVLMHYEDKEKGSGIDLAALEEAFKGGVKLFLFSNPNNPAGCVYSREEILKIAALAKQYGATLIVDELYSRQVYAGVEYTHLCAQSEIPENLITIIGPPDRIAQRLPPRRGLRHRGENRPHGEAPGHHVAATAAATTRPYSAAGSASRKAGSPRASPSTSASATTSWPSSRKSPASQRARQTAAATSSSRSPSSRSRCTSSSA